MPSWMIVKPLALSHVRNSPRVLIRSLNATSLHALHAAPSPSPSATGRTPGTVLTVAGAYSRTAIDAESGRNQLGVPSGVLTRRPRNRCHSYLYRVCVDPAAGR